MKKIIFPGSFDPITNGHVDLIERARKLFDEVEVVVLTNPNKKRFLTEEESIKLIELSTKELGITGVTATSTEKLLVEYCSDQDTFQILRGIRNATDLSFEYNLSVNNELLEHRVETICLLTKPYLFHVSSTFVREINSYNKSVSHLVPKVVSEYLENNNENL